MITIILDGRTDVHEYFRSSGIFDSERLNHTPLLAFMVSEDTVTVRIVARPTELLSLPDEILVMGQWTGKWHSDFFQFSVGQYRQHLEAKNELYRSAKNVVKTVGPKGGFQHLSFEYVNEQGITVPSSTSSRTEAERLLEIFVRNGIPVVIQNC